MQKLLRLIRKHTQLFIFLFCLVVFFFFLARNPFSTRTLIPNFDPFPDATYYLNPVFSLLHGHGLNMFREGRSLVPGVAPLYSLSLLPFFIIKQDPRMFYFANVLFSLLSFYIFYRIILKLLPSNEKKSSQFSFQLLAFSLLTFFSLFLYITNFYLSWYPTLAMAENLQHLLFLTGVYLLLFPVSKRNALFAGFIAVSFILVKYASFPLTITYFVLYVIKIISSHLQAPLPQRKLGSNLYLPFIFFFLSFFLIFSSYIYYDINYKDSNFINTFCGEAKVLSRQIPTKTSPSNNIKMAPPTGWFTFYRIPARFVQYLNAYAGGNNSVLWESTPLMPKYIAIVALCGLVLGLLSVNTFFFSFSLFSLLAGQTLFMSTYQTFDLRYVYNSIPTLLIGFVLFWRALFSFIRHPVLRRGISKYIFVFALLFFFLFYSITNIMSWKKTIMINLKYAEVPWYYLSVLKLNTDFPSMPKMGEKKPVVISSMLPHYIDFYSNKNYSLLPLDKTQDLMWFSDAVWGKQDYSNLNALYKNYIDRGYPVYLFSYYKGNRFTDDEVKKEFTLTLVSEGCFKTCNLYKLSSLKK